MSAFAAIWYAGRRDPTASQHRAINALLDKVVGRFKSVAEEKQDLFRNQLTAYRNLYGFLSQILPWQDPELEKLYTFVRNLAAKLPPPSDGRALLSTTKWRSRSTDCNRSTVALSTLPMATLRR
ncbi:MAG: hypothetical protein ACRED9_01580 [Caulobacteraceae bacterium]